MTPVDRLIATILRQERLAESLVRLMLRKSGSPNMDGQGPITGPDSPYGSHSCHDHDRTEDDSAW